MEFTEITDVSRVSSRQSVKGLATLSASVYNAGISIQATEVRYIVQ